MANSTAHQKFLISNPGTILSTNIIIRTFMTNENKPNVIKVMGKATNFNTAPIVAFTIARRKATQKAVNILLTLTPLNIYEEIATAIPETKVFTTNSITF